MRRAIASLRGQRHAPLDIIIALNGNRYDPAMVSELESAPDVTIVRCGEANLPRAIELGREAVGREFFCFLDDDDEYLEGALTARLHPALIDGSVDLVVTNGYRHRHHDELLLTNGHAVNDRPLESLFEQNWLASCGFLMRTGAVPVELFRGLPKYLEWTARAFRLVLAGKRFIYVDKPTFRYYFTPGSMWNRPEASVAGMEFVEGLLADPRVPDRLRPALRKKLSNNLHSIAAYYHNVGDTRMAWKYHLKSLGSIEGLRFIPYTRKLIALGLKPSREP